MSNDSRLGNVWRNRKPLPLGVRFPHLKRVRHTANPESHDETVRILGREYANYRKQCMFCGEVFYAKSPKRKYCSYRCTNDAYITRRRERNKLKRRKVCLFCKTPFTAKSLKARFCSPKCRVAHFRKRKRYDSKLVSSELNGEPLQDIFNYGRRRGRDA